MTVTSRKSEGGRREVIFVAHFLPWWNTVYPHSSREGHNSYQLALSLATATVTATVSLGSSNCSFCLSLQVQGWRWLPKFLVPRIFTLPRGFPYAHQHSVSCLFIKLSSVTIYCLPGLWLIGQHCGLCLYSHRLYLNMAPTASSSLWLLSEHLMKEEIKPSMNYQT